VTITSQPLPLPSEVAESESVWLGGVSLWDQLLA
jgi:hypothetical protein